MAALRSTGQRRARRFIEVSLLEQRTLLLMSPSISSETVASGKPALGHATSIPYFSGRPSVSARQTCLRLLYPLVFWHFPAYPAFRGALRYPSSEAETSRF
jgi:hypothetical protein